MINSKEIKKKLLKEVNDFLLKYGFEKKIYGQSLRKPIEGGKAFIHLSFINHVNDFDITVSVAVRIDAMEAMANAANRFLTEKEKKKSDSATIGVELGNLSGVGQKRWTITNENDIPSVVVSISKDIIEIAFPFIEKYKDANAIFKTMLRDDPAVWTVAPFHYSRAINAVGLAKLLNRDEMLDSIIADKTKFLEERNDYGLQMFLDFVKTVENKQ